jgi:hypothetical protein
VGSLCGPLSCIHVLIKTREYDEILGRNEVSKKDYNTKHD